MADKPLILVTGGAGYIGRVLTQKLIEYGARVRVLDTFYFPSDSFASTGMSLKNLDLVQGDITNSAARMV